MKGHRDPPDRYDPPQVGRAVPFKIRIARAIAIVVCATSIYMVIAGLAIGLFVGPHLILGALLWVIPGVGSAFLLRSSLDIDRPIEIRHDNG